MTLPRPPRAAGTGALHPPRAHRVPETWRAYLPALEHEPPPELAVEAA